MKKLLLNLLLLFAALPGISQTLTTVVKQGVRPLDTNRVAFDEHGKELRYYQYQKLLHSGKYKLLYEKPDLTGKLLIKAMTIEEEIAAAERVKKAMAAKSPVLKENSLLDLVPFQSVVDVKTLDNKIIILLFWSPQCPPCTESFEGINELLAQIQNTENLAVFAVTRESQQIALDKLKHKPLNYSKLISEGQTIFNSYQLNTIPTFIITDKDHVIRLAVTGIGPQVLNVFKMHLYSILQQ